MAGREYCGGDFRFRVVRVGLITALAPGVVVGALLYALATPMLTVLGEPPDSIGPGTHSLRVLTWAVPFAAVSFTLLGAGAGIGATRACQGRDGRLRNGRATLSSIRGWARPSGAWCPIRCGFGVAVAVPASVSASGRSAIRLRHWRGERPDDMMNMSRLWGNSQSALTDGSF
ncbi:MATE family efflux transporter [Streptomyces sp. NPDC003832]